MSIFNNITKMEEKTVHLQTQQKFGYIARSNYQTQRHFLSGEQQTYQKFDNVRRRKFCSKEGINTIQPSSPTDRAKGVGIEVKSAFTSQHLISSTKKFNFWKNSAKMQEFSTLFRIIIRS